MVDRASPVRCLTTDQLTQIWRSGSKASESWSQIGSPGGYQENFISWGPGTDTETFAWFTFAVNHVKGITRDYNNTLHKEAATVRAVAGYEGAIGYADYPYYRRDRSSSVRLVALDSGDGCVTPSPRTIASDAFRPLARRLFLYVSTPALGRPEVQAFLRFCLDHAAVLARQAGFVALTPAQLAASRANLRRLIASASG